MPRRAARAHAATWQMAPTRSSSSRARLASTSSPASPPSPTDRSSPTSRSTSTHRSLPRPRDPSIRPPPSANISPPRDVRVPASLSPQVPGASPSREQDGPLSLAARLGRYTMLAGLVVASFTVTPARRAQVSATPTIDDEPAAARIAPMSRGLVRALREIDNLELMVSPAPTSELTQAPPVAAVPEAPPEATVEPEPEATAEPEPEVTVEPEPDPVSAPDPTSEPTR